MKQTKTKTQTQNKAKKKYKIVATIDIPHGEVFTVEATSKKEAERIIKRNMKRDIVMIDNYFKTEQFPFEKGYKGFSPMYPLVYKKSMKFYLQK